MRLIVMMILGASERDDWDFEDWERSRVWKEFAMEVLDSIRLRPICMQ